MKVILHDKERQYDRQTLTVAKHGLDIVDKHKTRMDAIGMKYLRRKEKKTKRSGVK